MWRGPGRGPRHLRSGAAARCAAFFPSRVVSRRSVPPLPILSGPLAAFDFRPHLRSVLAPSPPLLPCQFVPRPRREFGIRHARRPPCVRPHNCACSHAKWRGTIRRRLLLFLRGPYGCRAFLNRLRPRGILLVASISPQSRVGRQSPPASWGRAGASAPKPPPRFCSRVRAEPELHPSGRSVLPSTAILAPISPVSGPF
jgi:hypothetical protein